MKKPDFSGFFEGEAVTIWEGNGDEGGNGRKNFFENKGLPGMKTGCALMKRAFGA